MKMKFRVILPALLLFMVLFFIPAVKVKASPTGYWTQSGHYYSGWFNRTTRVDCYGNNGSQSRPYSIRSARDLAALSYLSNLSDGPSFSGKYISFDVSELNMAQYEWVPIGQNKRFYGTISGNGNGVIIHNLLLGSSSNGLTYQTSGFFGQFYGTARNINLKEINYTLGSNDTAESIGGFAAFNGGSIDNCTVEGEINVTGTGVKNLGGFIGDGLHGYTCSNCRADVSIVAHQETRYGYWGGFYGLCGQTSRSCQYSGDIRLYQSVYHSVGGFTGDGNGAGSIENCRSEAYIFLSNTTITCAGGFVGSNAFDIVNSIAEGSIRAEFSEMSVVGGFAGSSSNASYNQCNSFVALPVSGAPGVYAGGFIGCATNCSISGCRQGCEWQGLSVFNVKKVGGFVAEATATTITDSSTSISVTVATDSSEQKCVGGFCGVAKDSCNLIRCYAHLSIHTGIYCTVGGFCGDATNSIIRSCYTVGTIQCYRYCITGGFFGSCSGMVTSACYTCNQITAGQNSLLGGAIGQNNGYNSAVKIYWNWSKDQTLDNVSRASGNKKAVGNDVGISTVVLKTDDYMKSQTFVNNLRAQDSETDWKYGGDTGYPYF